ncbi:MAG: hypothetical protein SFX73_35865 [Kofleriaceae bacterium]|nr:hypothetical protein [Kofleriaceae bacterium]
MFSNHLLAALTALLAVAACASMEEPNELEDDGFADLGGKTDGDADWTSIGHGVAYQRVNTGNAILIAYGGYSAKLAHSAAWASELVDARLGAADVGHIYAIKGPADVTYAAREIANTKLRAHLETLSAPDDEAPATDAPIYIVAHSSGSYVAHELLSQLDASAATSTLARIVYANLDGGGYGLTRSIASQLAGLTFAYAHDPTLSRGLSQNSGTAIALGAAYAPLGASFEVRVPNSGCASGAGWCLHDAVITHRPHNPYHYDLARDYTDFVDRAVTTEYLEQFLPSP